MKELKYLSVLYEFDEGETDLRKSPYGNNHQSPTVDEGKIAASNV